MIQTVERETIVEMLLNSLEAERYVRRPLLHNIVDELAADARFSSAAVVAHALLERLDSVARADFEKALREIRALVRNAAPRSGVVATRYAKDPIAGAA